MIELRIVPKANYNSIVFPNVLALRFNVLAVDKRKEVCKGVELGRGRKALFLSHGYLCTAHITIDIPVR